MNAQVIKPGLMSTMKVQTMGISPYTSNNTLKEDRESDCKLCGLNHAQGVSLISSNFKSQVAVPELFCFENIIQSPPCWLINDLDCLLDIDLGC